VTADPRPYRSALRDEQSRATRRRIVDAGAALFVERGFVPTTIDAIAERAGVSRKTVFTSVGGKSAVLKLAFDWALAGDDEPVAIADRPEVRRMMQQSDPAILLEAWMAMNAAINQRVAALHHVLVVAADADQDAAALLATTDDQRAEGAGRVVRRIAELGGLWLDLDHDKAAAIADVLIDPMLYRRLVGLRGWPFETYVEHLQRIAVASLLTDHAVHSGGTASPS
jgi:AcrR family transcriptional regulator